MLNHKQKIISNIYFTKKYDQFHINNLNIYDIPFAYEILFTRLTQKYKEHKRYQRNHIDTHHIKY